MVNPKINAIRKYPIVRKIFEHDLPRLRIIGYLLQDLSRNFR
jgi:hypothetical protein